MKIVVGAPANGAELKKENRKFLEKDERVTSVADLSSPDVTYPVVSIRAAEMIVRRK